MLNFIHKRPLLACLLTSVALVKLTSGAPLDPTFFPEAAKHSDEVIRVHGLAQLYPGTILFESPELITRSEREEAARIEKLPRNITYIRIYRLDEAIPVIKEALSEQAVILDMRYLQSSHTGAALVPLLQSQQTATQVTPTGAVPKAIINQLQALQDTTANTRRYPTVVLCNRQTAGPFEAILYSLQSNGSIIVVGEATAGRTGYYKQTETQAWMIEGELRPTAETSLIATGVIPRIEIEGSPEKNYMSYHLYEAGTNILRLLKDDTVKATMGAEEHELGEQDFEPDAVLQRGVDIVAALQILQQLPDSH